MKAKQCLFVIGIKIINVRAAMYGA